MYPVDLSIEVQNRTATATVPIPGTDVRLTYDSALTAGDARNRTIEIPVTGNDVPAEVLYVVLSIEVAGQETRIQFDTSPNRRYTYTWDGRDGFGRRVYGMHQVHIGVGYAYEGEYNSGSGGGGGSTLSFAALPDVDDVTGVRAREEVILWRRYTTTVSNDEVIGLGLHGWQADAQRSTRWYQQRIRQYHGRRSLRLDRDISLGESLTAGPDGRIYFGASGTGGLGWREPDGTYLGIGNPGGYSGDGAPASEAEFHEVEGVALGDDGALYVAQGHSQGEDVVRRIDPPAPDGTVTRVAGLRDAEETGAEGTPNADLGVATETALARVVDAFAGPDGVYVVENGNDFGFSELTGAVRRLTPDGRLEAVFGDIDGTQVSQATEGQATEMQAYPVTGTVGPDGTLFVAEETAIWEIGTDGRAQVIAGDPTAGSTVPYNPAENGRSAASATFGEITALVYGDDGNLYVADDLQKVIRAITPAGRIVTVAGGSTTPFDPEEGEPHTVPATAVRVSPRGMTIDPEGVIWADSEARVVALERASSVRAFWATDGTSYVSSPDGSEAYGFDSTGHHVETRDTLTGSVTRAMEYGAENRLSAIVDGDGNRTEFERDGDGDLTAIVAPTGQRTEVTTDANGYLDSLTLPGSATTTLNYDENGLLQSVTDPDGETATVAYDSQGQVTAKTDRTGATTDFTGSGTPDDHTVTRVSPELREARHRARRITDRDREYVTTCCGGRESRTLIAGGASTYEITYADGTTADLTQTGDPRFGLSAPVTEEAVVRAPGGLEQRTLASQTVDLDDPLDPLSHTRITRTVEVNGRGLGGWYERSTDTITVYTTEGRNSETVLDDQGRLASMTLAGRTPVTVDRDSMGRLTGITRGTGTLSLEYDADWGLAAVELPDAGRWRYVRDALGRPTEATTPADNTYVIDWDPNGTLGSLTMPNGDSHQLEYDEEDRFGTYALPSGGTYALAYDGDGLPTDVTLPSGRSITNTYGPGGKRTGASHPDADVTVDRDTAGRPTAMTRTPTSSTPQSLQATWDGRLLRQLAYDGPATGTFRYDYDHNLWLVGIRFPDGDAFSMTRDGDGSVTGYGPFEISRGGPATRPSEYTDTGSGGTLTVTYSYDAVGRPAGRTHTVDGTVVYETTYDYDDVDRLTERTETVDGTTRTEIFAYDADGRLTDVQRDGALFERYTYDGNGNRTERTTAAGTTTASYGAGDILQSVDGTAYTFDADGFLSARGSDSFDYSATGELLSATVGGETVTYDYDAYGRMVARTTPDGTTQYLYGDPTAFHRLTVAVDPDGTRTRYHYDDGGRPYAMERDDTWYYLVADQVGTPRLVVATDGTVVKEIDTDAYGVIRADSDPSVALHIGFAAGVGDPLTGLVRFGMRDYDPATGRFTARDPALLAGGSLNYYAYAHDDPVNGVDRTGLSWGCWWDGTKDNYDTTMDGINSAFGYPIKMAAKLGTSGVVASNLGTWTGMQAAKNGYAMVKTGTSLGRAAGLATRMAVSTAAVNALAVETALRVGVGIGSAINPFREHSLGEQIGDSLFNLLNDDPYEDSDFEEPKRPADCGAKTPENC